MQGLHPSIGGGTVVLLLAAALTLGGLVLCGIGFTQRQPVALALGVVLMLPGGGLLVVLLATLGPEMIPRTRSWDLSTDRRASQLGETPVGDNYYFQGNLHTALTLPGGRRWSGRATHVVFQRRGEEIEQTARYLAPHPPSLRLTRVLRTR